MLAAEHLVSVMSQTQVKENRRSRLFVFLVGVRGLLERVQEESKACSLFSWSVVKFSCSLDRLACVINQRRGKYERKEIKAESHGIALIGKGRHGCQDKTGMEKQHNANIMAVKVQIGWLWRRGRGRGRVELEKTLDVTEVDVRCLGKVLDADVNEEINN
ncbi:hypothetical protein Tco_0718068 [Tanacetum coccineum]